MGSLHCPPSGICLPLHPSRLHSEAEEQEVRILALDSEPVSEEEAKLKVEGHQRFFRPCIWINQPFWRLRVLAEG